MVRNGEGLVAGRLVVMADWCSMAFENDGGREVVEVVDWCSMAFENGDGVVVGEGSMAFENGGWFNVRVGWRCVLSTAVESGGW